MQLVDLRPGRFTQRCVLTVKLALFWSHVVLLLALPKMLLGQTPPLFYDKEHTGEEFKLQQLPELENFPIIRPLPDPFAWSAGNGRSTAFKDWARRRAEISSEVQHYGIGYREDGAKLASVVLTTYPFGPDALKTELSQQPVSLKRAAGTSFKVGVGVGHKVLQNQEDAELIRLHFDILTPENCMKPQSIHPAEDRWDFGATDRFAEFVRKNDLEMVGHCLVWAKDDRTDTWMMTDGDKPVSRERLLARIETHISTVVDRYADVVTMWDVVNEAIGDGDEEMLRDSIYSRACGIDFIVTAFKAARKAAPNALLIYNDYNGHKPAKRKKLIQLLTELKNAGAPVDAYGMQGHFELGDDSIQDLRDTFQALRELGLKVVISELDIDVVKRGQWWADDGKHRDELAKYNPYVDGLPKATEEEQVKQYKELFRLFIEFEDTIERVSFWNLHDGQSWLNYFPWNRVNHPLLFDRSRQPKPAFHAVLDALNGR